MVGYNDQSAQSTKVTGMNVTYLGFSVNAFKIDSFAQSALAQVSNGFKKA